MLLRRLLMLRCLRCIEKATAYSSHMLGGNAHVIRVHRQEVGCSFSSQSVVTCVPNAQLLHQAVVSSGVHRPLDLSVDCVSVSAYSALGCMQIAHKRSQSLQPLHATLRLLKAGHELRVIVQVVIERG